MENMKLFPNSAKQVGVLDYVGNDGLLVKNCTVVAVMVRSSSDLADIAGEYPPGTIAFTAGGGYKWQLAADGDWEEWS